MLAYDTKTMEAMTGPARHLFEQWISFFPTAPFFGVEWRFAPNFEMFPTDFSMTTPGFSFFGAGTTTSSEKPAEAAPAPRKAAAPKPDAVEEAVVVKAEQKPAPTTEAAEKKPTHDGGSINQIRGIGPRLAEELGELGISTVAQIAALSRAEMTKIDEQLNGIRGRCFRDDWIGQAKALMAA